MLASPHYSEAKQAIETLLSKAKDEHEEYKTMSREEKGQVSCKFNDKRKHHLRN